jgi:Raf kinase inhibitor-like YbhB/YbcL family protein
MAVAVPRRALIALSCAALAPLLACRHGGANEEGIMPEVKTRTLNVTSHAFAEGATIPRAHTCDGADQSPPLSWTGAPGGTRSYALIVDDPDSPGGTFAHWVAWNIRAPELAANVARDASLANGMQQGVNSFKRVGYSGPCPPSGTHRYFFKLYALDVELKLEPKSDKEALLDAIKGHVLAQGELMGRYARD